MSARIILNNRVIWASPDFNRINWNRAMPKDRDGNTIDCASAIPCESPQTPFRAGVPLWDSAEGIVYRVIEKCLPKDGWALSEFWQKRWHVDHVTICSLVACGMLDAAIEAGGRIKRYRCRDENRLRQSKELAKQRARLNRIKNPIVTEEKVIQRMSKDTL